MTMRVMRPDDGRMMILRMYDLHPETPPPVPVFTLNPGSGNFSKASPANLTTAYQNGTVLKIQNGANVLAETTDYTIDTGARTITFLQSYLSTLSNGTVGLDVYYNTTEYKSFAVTIAD